MARRNLFHQANGLHGALFIACSDDGLNGGPRRFPDRWPDWACVDHSVRAPAVRPASCPAAPAVAEAGQVRAPVGAPPGEGCREAPRAEARSVVPALPAVSPAVRSASHRDPAILAERAKLAAVMGNEHRKADLLRSLPDTILIARDVVTHCSLPVSPVGSAQATTTAATAGCSCNDIMKPA